MQCVAVTKKGSQCPLKATFPDGKCHVHSEAGKYQRQLKQKRAKSNQRTKKRRKQKRRVNYKEYIQSEAWKDRRRKAKEQAGWRCQLCNKSGNDRTLHAHHRTYRNLGNEQAGDITVLCDDCHSRFHHIGERR